MKEEVRLMKGNEAIAHAAIRYGCDGYFGYPYHPQSEVLETLEALMPWETSGMVVLQAESEVAAINMVYGGAASGKAVMTSSSSPGVSLKQEGISYLAGAMLPALVLNVMRGGPASAQSSPLRPTISRPLKAAATATTTSSCSHLPQCRKWWISLASALTWLSNIATPSMILADGIVGQMMEKVVLPNPARAAQTKR